MRKQVDVFFDEVRHLYNEWDLKAMVLVSLCLQVMLLILGGRRKFSPSLKLRGAIWCAYVCADSITVVALGIISSQIGDVNGSMDKKTRLLSLWASCLLLLLGGPDTITAYALEDNELWLRHLVGLVVQIVATGYMYFLSWSVSYLSLMSILMYTAGLIKCGERTWVLWLASSERLRESMLSAEDPSLNYPRFMDEYSLKLLEGYHVTPDEVLETKVEPIILANPDAYDEVDKAYFLFHIFKRLLVDLILSSDDLHTSRAIFKNESLSWESAVNIVEIELGFMFDLLYTKANILYSRWGVSRRFITFTLSSLVLVMFSSTTTSNDDHKHYPRVDLALTFLLLATILFIEIYSLILLASSDRASVWITSKKHNNAASSCWAAAAIWWKTTALVTYLQPPPRRWSKKAGQLDFLSLCIKEKPMPFQKILNRMNLHNKLSIFFCADYVDITTQIQIDIPKEIIRSWGWGDFSHHGLLNFVLYGEGENYTSHVWDEEGKRVLQEAAGSLEFDEAILVWHVATQLCYSHCSDRERISEEVELAVLISRYMFYILVRYPFMLPNGTGQIRLRDTLDNAHKFLLEKSDEGAQNLNNQKACEILLEMKDDKSNPLYTASQLGSALSSTGWRYISRSWLALLASAAHQSSGASNAQQLRRGGELITHTWMMLAHHGLTENLETQQPRNIAKLVLN